MLYLASEIKSRPFKDLVIDVEVLEIITEWEHVGYVQQSALNNMRSEIEKVVGSNSVLLIYDNMHTITREIYREIAIRKCIEVEKKLGTDKRNGTMTTIGRLVFCGNLREAEQARDYYSSNHTTMLVGLGDNSIRKAVIEYEAGTVDVLIFSNKGQIHGWYTSRTSIIEFWPKFPASGPNLTQARGRYRPTITKEP